METMSEKVIRLREQIANLESEINRIKHIAIGMALEAEAQDVPPSSINHVISHCDFSNKYWRMDEGEGFKDCYTWTGSRKEREAALCSLFDSRITPETKVVFTDRAYEVVGNKTFIMQKYGMILPANFFTIKLKCRFYYDAPNDTVYIRDTDLVPIYDKFNLHFNIPPQC